MEYVAIACPKEHQKIFRKTNQYKGIVFKMASMMTAGLEPKMHIM